MSKPHNVRRNHIDLILNTKVKAVQRHSVTVSDGAGQEREIPFGACVWATGVAMHPVIKQASCALYPHQVVPFSPTDHVPLLRSSLCLLLPSSSVPILHPSSSVTFTPVKLSALNSHQAQCPVLPSSSVPICFHQALCLGLSSSFVPFTSFKLCAFHSHQLGLGSLQALRPLLTSIAVNLMSLSRSMAVQSTDDSVAMAGAIAHPSSGYTHGLCQSFASMAHEFKTDEQMKYRRIWKHRV